jgi:hypothetical protein
MIKTLTQKIVFIGSGMFWLTVSAQGAILYNNTSTDTGNSLDLLNGAMIGNEVKLAGVTSAFVTNFSFEIYSTLATFAGGANVQMEAFLYANNGTNFNGYASPSTTLYDSGLFTLLTPQQSEGLNAVTLNFDLSSTPASVGNDLTLAIVVTGLTNSDAVGMELFDPASVGQNYGDYWANNNGAGWKLLTNSVPTDFGAKFSGTAAPEPSTLGLGAIGMALLMGFNKLRPWRDSSNKNRTF